MHRGCVVDARRMQSSCRVGVQQMQSRSTAEAQRVQDRCVMDAQQRHGGCRADAGQMHSGCTLDAWQTLEMLWEAGADPAPPRHRREAGPRAGSSGPSSEGAVAGPTLHGLSEC